MKKIILYNYLGTNGVIQSPIHLEDIYYTRSIQLTADNGKKLVNKLTGEEKISVAVAEDEISLWVEEKE